MLKSAPKAHESVLGSAGASPAPFGALAKPLLVSKNTPKFPHQTRSANGDRGSGLRLGQICYKFKP
jgi:hypothetical protein